MAFRAYRSRDQMTQAGWRFPSPEELSECNRCGARISWAKSPKGASVPMQPDGSPLVHFDVCRQPGNAPAFTANRTPPSPALQSSPAAAYPIPIKPDLVQTLADLTLAVRALNAALQRPSDGFARRATGGSFVPRRTAVTGA
jgi:hypothetical protein